MKDGWLVMLVSLGMLLGCGSQPGLNCLANLFNYNRTHQALDGRFPFNINVESPSRPTSRIEKLAMAGGLVTVFQQAS